MKDNIHRTVWRIATLNINGWRASVRRGLEKWMAEADLDIICIQETRMNRAQVELACPSTPGVSSYFASGTAPGYSGTAILTRKVPVTIGVPINPILCGEGRTLVAQYGNLIVVSAYVPNGNRSPERLRYKMAYLRLLIEYMEELARGGYHVVVCGDFNTAHSEMDLSPAPNRARRRSGFLDEERDLLSSMVDAGWSDAFRVLYPDERAGFTWWANHANARERNAGWRFDYIFVPRDQGVVVKSATIERSTMVSDHCPFVISIERAEIDGEEVREAIEVDSTWLAPGRGLWS
jgi:exodeoxyribonuclease III